MKLTAAAMAMAATMLICAQPVAAQVYVMGIGGITCGQHLTNRETFDKNSLIDGTYWPALIEWLRGYETGRNDILWEKKGAQNTGTIEKATALPYVDKYCREHPLLGVFAAANCYLAELNNQKAPPYCKQ